MKKYFKNSFTLIEILVVIAIIGILASISFLLLKGAVYKARDSRIITAISQARSFAEIINNQENNYTNFCNSGDINTGHTQYGGELTAINNEIIDNGGTTGCWAENNQYCLYSSLNLSEFFCADSSGKAFTTATDPSTSCYNGSYICP